MGQRLGAVLALVVLAGCSDRRAAISADSWWAPPTDFTNFTPLDGERFAVVIADLQSEAQAALTEEPAKRLIAEEAVRLIGRRLPTAGGEYVLLRAVVLLEDTGGFYMGVRGSAVHVRHGCLGRQPAPMSRKAVVAVLPAVPEFVFVSCSMAE